MFFVVPFGFLPQLKATFWFHPCVGKVDTASFWPISWWKCEKPVADNTRVLIGGKTEDNTGKPEVFKGKDRVIREEHGII